MFKILIVAATQAEIQPAVAQITGSGKRGANALQNVDITFFVTGVGMVNTALNLGTLHNNTFDLVINAGIAGSFGKYKTGDVVNVKEDCFSELGAEDGERFLSSDEIGLGRQNVAIQKTIHHALINQLPLAKGITVNTVHGNEKSIEMVTKRYQADVETMEGAAFIQAANTFGWHALQLRAISNKVEKRNKESWQIPMAIENLNKVLLELLEDLDRKTLDK